ncbi:hypothetical protein EJB05_37133, partial [Eragrostis curvula]
MASPGPSNPSAAAGKHMRVLLPFSHKALRIPDELAEDIGAAEAHVVVPFGKGKVGRVEVGRDGDGAFLGLGWPEFADAFGVGAGWLLVLRHHGGGVLTVKAFDDSCCLRELATQTPAVDDATDSSNDSPHKPQFIGLLPPDSREKMQIPARFLQSYIPKDDLNSHVAIFLGPHGKVSKIEVKMNCSDVFFAGGWSQFLMSHDITGGNCLLLRYEGNMVFTVKVFEPNGCQRKSEHKDDIRFQQNEQNNTRAHDSFVLSALSVDEKKHEKPSFVIEKCKGKSNWLGDEGQMETKISKTYFGKASFRNSVYRIGPPSWIKKQINTNSLKKSLALAAAFCDGIGLHESRTITLKTSMDRNASWQVRGWSQNGSSYILLGGWRRFCKENTLKVGDICTFNVVEATLWNVVITRYSEKQDVTSASSAKCKSKNDRTNCEEQMGQEDSMTSLTKATSPTKCVYDTRPPAWLKKEINTSLHENQFYFPLTFCKAIGLREPSMVTLKISTSSTISWKARVVPYKTCAYMHRLGWRTFCRENGIKIGDVCTFNIIETTLWHVVVTRQ